MIGLTERQNAILGIIGSSLEVTIQYPLHTIKNKLQENKPIPFNPSVLYKGVFINMYSLGVITGAQFYMYKQLYNLTNNDFASSFTSGCISGFIAAPSETFILQKHYHPGQKFNLMHSNLIKKNGFLKIYTRGLLATMMRESIYTTGMLTLTPYLEKEYEINGLTASIYSGIISSILSHPFDTIKTHQQVDLNCKNIFNKLIKDSYNVGYRKLASELFPGLFPRVTRIIGTFFIINESNKYFNDFVKDYC